MPFVRSDQSSYLLSMSAAIPRSPSPLPSRESAIWPCLTLEMSARIVERKVADLVEIEIAVDIGARRFDSLFHHGQVFFHGGKLPIERGDRRKDGRAELDARPITHPVVEVAGG